MNNKWIVLGLIVIVGLGITFGDTYRFYHMCIAPIIEAVCRHQPDTGVDQTDAVLQGTEDDNH